jgi:GNAT superfamily N-acetyltransferase
MADARWAGPADKADVERLFFEYLALQGEPLDRLAFSKTWRASLRPTTGFRFAVVGAPASGVAAFATIHDTYSTHAGGPTLRVEDLFVDPDHSGQGHRQRLIAFAEEYARRQKARHVDVFLQAETSLDPDFLPKGFEPLASPPFRKSLVKPSGGSRRRSSARKGRTGARAAHRDRDRRRAQVPTGQELTELFR